MLFCERSFGTFFVLWGLWLVLEKFVVFGRGLFYNRLDHYLPTCAWGSLLILIGVSRYIAFKRRSKPWRLRLSLLTFLMLVIISAVAFSSGLWAATGPLSAFLAYIAFWCHGALIRDIGLGL